MTSPRVRQALLPALLSALMMLSPALPALAQSVPPEIQVFTLPSGQKLYVKEDHSQPIVTVDTWVNVGSVNETDEINGVSHFLEHLLFKGTDNHEAGEFERVLEARGGEFNAATSDDFTHYYITIAAPFLEEALDLHADMLTHAAIPEDELTRERLVVQEEINRANDNPTRLLYSALAERMYGKHGYGYDTLGPKENIANVPRQSILDYYHYWYQPKNFHTIVVGDVDAQRVKTLVSEAFNTEAFGVPASYQPPATGTPQFPSTPQVNVSVDPDITQAYMILGFPGPAVSKPEDTYAMDMAMLALGGGKSSRLYRRLVEQEPLTTSVGAGNFTQKYSGLLYVNATTTPDKLDTVKQELLSQLLTLKENGITTEELAKVKTSYLKDFVYQNETTSGAASSLGYSVTIGSLEDYDKHLERIRAVSTADVQDALKRYLDFNESVLIELLPPGAQDRAASEEKAGLALLQTAANPAAGKSRPCVDVLKTESDINKTVLANGLTLIRKPQDNTETVAIKVLIQGGQSVENLPGVAGLTASMLMQGTTSRTAEEISEELESKGLGLSASTTEDYLEVSGSALREDLGELFQILRDVIRNPLFDETELAKQKVLVARSLQASRDNPSTVAFENLTLNLYPNHPYGNVGKRIEESLPQITREQLLHYYAATFQPKNMLVVAVGNFQSDTLAHYVQEAFTGLPVVAPAEPLRTAPAVTPLSEAKVVEVPQENLSAVWMAQGWLMPEIEDQADYLPLKVLNTVLGEGMSSRLFVNLREKQGLAYTVGSFYPSREETSRFVLYIGSDPVNRETVRQGFMKELEALKSTRLTPDELQSAKDKLTGNFALAHETNAAQAQYLGMYESLGVGYEFDERYPELIQQVSAEDVQRVAQKYFSRPSVLSLVAPAQKSEKPVKTED